jgi:hypothetical protein
MVTENLGTIGDEDEGRGRAGGLLRRALNLGQERRGRRRSGRVQRDSVRAITQDARSRAGEAARGAGRAIRRLFGRR